MKIERISDDKIKVEINSEDVKLWNVNIKKLTDNTQEAQNLFWYAIKKAEKDFDFSVGSSRLLVEAIPLKNEGFVMIISKVNSDEDVVDTITKNSALRFKNAEISIKRVKKTAPLEKYKIYKFKNFDDLCSGIFEICHLFIGNSTVYKYGDEFYLKLEPKDLVGFFEIDNKISEFSQRCKNTSFMQGYLLEHGEVFISFEAVETISCYFM